MKFQNIKAPDPKDKIGETSWLTESTILKPLLNKHMAPKGKVALLIVKEGTLDFVWEDDLDTVYSCDKKHAIVIEPERYHHVILTGPVEFKIEFYKDISITSFNDKAIRPREEFTTK